MYRITEYELRLVLRPHYIYFRDRGNQPSCGLVPPLFFFPPFRVLLHLKGFVRKEKKNKKNTQHV